LSPICFAKAQKKPSLRPVLTTEEEVSGAERESILQRSLGLFLLTCAVLFAGKCTIFSAKNIINMAASVVKAPKCTRRGSAKDLAQNAASTGHKSSNEANWYVKQVQNKRMVMQFRKFQQKTGTGFSSWPLSSW